MELKLNKYKVYKLKIFISTVQLFIFCNAFNLNIRKCLKVEQNLINKTFQYQRLCNNLTKILIQKSIFKNLIRLINGSNMCVSVKAENKEFLFFKKLQDVNFTLVMLYVRINNKIYSMLQFKNIKNINYIFNILKLHKLFKKLLIKLFQKFLKQFSK